MNVNFTGFHNARLQLGYLEGLPKFQELKNNSKNILRFECNVSDDENGADLSELKRVMCKSREFRGQFANFTPIDTLTIDITKSVMAQDFGYAVDINEKNIDQWDNRSIFGICTFLCTLSAKLFNLQDNKKSIGAQYLQLINKISSKIGKSALKYVR